MATKERQDAIQIRADRDGERSFLLHPSNDDLFVRTGKQVIEACRLGISIEVWVEEFNAMLERVRAWTAERAGRVRACYCTPRGARVALFFVPASDAFDFELADELTELNSELVSQFNVGMVDVHQIPGDEIERFLNVDSARQVYGDRPGSHQAVEAQ